MRFLDQFGKVASQAADAAAQAMERARFEAEKFQKTSRIQGELSELKERLDEKFIELGQRTFDLYRTGQISLASISDLVQVIEHMRVDVIKKEDELRRAQAEAYVEPEAGAAPSASGVQSVQVDEAGNTTASQPASQPADQPASQQPSSARTPPAAEPAPTEETTKQCPACSFQMPARAVFCPNCGFRVGTSNFG